MQVITRAFSSLWGSTSPSQQLSVSSERKMEPHEEYLVLIGDPDGTESNTTISKSEAISRANAVGQDSRFSPTKSAPKNPQRTYADAQRTGRSRTVIEMARPQQSFQPQQPFHHPAPPPQRAAAKHAEAGMRGSRPPLEMMTLPKTGDNSPDKKQEPVPVKVAESAERSKRGRTPRGASQQQRQQSPPKANEENGTLEVEPYSRGPWAAEKRLHVDGVQKHNQNAQSLQSATPAPLVPASSSSPRSRLKSGNDHNINSPHFFTQIGSKPITDADEVVRSDNESSQDSTEHQSKKKKTSERVATPYPKKSPVARMPRGKEKKDEKPTIVVIDSDDEKEKVGDRPPSPDLNDAEPESTTAVIGNFPIVYPSYLQLMNSHIRGSISIKFLLESLEAKIEGQVQKIPYIYIDRIEISRTGVGLVSILFSKKAPHKFPEHFVFAAEDDIGDWRHRLVFKFNAPTDYMNVFNALPAHSVVKAKLEDIRTEVLKKIDWEVAQPSTASRPVTRSSALAATRLDQPQVVLVYPPHPRTDGIQITLEDMGRLDPNEFLNDSIIDMYIKWLKIKGLPAEVEARFYFFSTFFFRKLHQVRQSESNSIAKWTKKDDIFSKDFIVIPMNESLHWNLMIVCHASKAVQRAKDPQVSFGANNVKSNDEADEADEEDEEEVDIPSKAGNNQPPQPQKRTRQTDIVESLSSALPRKALEDASLKPRSRSPAKNGSRVEFLGADSTTPKRPRRGHQIPIVVEESPVAASSSKASKTDDTKAKSSSLPKITVEQGRADTDSDSNSDFDSKKPTKDAQRDEDLSAAILGARSINPPPAAPAPPEPMKLDDDIIVKPKRKAASDYDWQPPPTRVARNPPKPKPVPDPDMPCMLVFDSLRLRVNHKAADMIRSYLSEEWKRKKGEDFKFDKSNLPVKVVKVPTQDNSSDCGVYLLHYLEQFAKDNIPPGELYINGKEQWFPESKIRDKRNFIRDLIERLRKEQEVDSQRAANAAKLEAPVRPASPTKSTSPPPPLAAEAAVTVPSANALMTGPANPAEEAASLTLAQPVDVKSADTSKATHLSRSPSPPPASSAATSATSNARSNGPSRTSASPLRDSKPVDAQSSLLLPPANHAPTISPTTESSQQDSDAPILQSSPFSLPAEAPGASVNAESETTPHAISNRRSARANKKKEETNSVDEAKKPSVVKLPEPDQQQKEDLKKNDKKKEETRRVQQPLLSRKVPRLPDPGTLPHPITPVTPPVTEPLKSVRKDYHGGKKKTS